jgi:peptidoglycan/LPS O-acetylase OafA/YrhL
MERPRRGLAWLGIDVACVLVFCSVGRRSHDEGLNVAGIATTAWPFLSGTTLGWLLSQAWRRPSAVYPTGVVVWLSTVVVGMLLRKVTSAGVAGSFVVVAATVTALLLLGWRALAQPGRRAKLSKRQA